MGTDRRPWQVSRPLPDRSRLQADTRAGGRRSLALILAWLSRLLLGLALAPIGGAIGTIVLFVAYLLESLVTHDFGDLLHDFGALPLLSVVGGFFALPVTLIGLPLAHGVISARRSVLMPIGAGLGALRMIEPEWPLTWLDPLVPDPVDADSLLPFAAGAIAGGVCGLLFARWGRTMTASHITGDIDPMRLLIALIALLAALSPAQAALRDPQVRGLRIGMTIAQATAVLKSLYPGADPAATTQPCAAPATTCITKLVGGLFGDQTVAYFVEDLPAAPGTMRLYAAASLASDPKAPQWLAALSKSEGRPDCAHPNDPNFGAIRVWTARGAVKDCGMGGAQLPMPVADEFPTADADRNAKSPLRAPLLIAKIIGGNVHQLVLIDLGYYAKRNPPR